MHASLAQDRQQWDSFLLSQPYRPFLQSWTMGDVYADTGQEPVRIEVRNDAGEISGICLAILVPARRGRHLSVPYGPVVSGLSALPAVFRALKEEAVKRSCSFIRVSPFVTAEEKDRWKTATGMPSVHAPMHMLAEHLWLLPLTSKSEEEILTNMRKTTRNLVRRADKEGIEVTASADPNRDVEEFIALHDETRKRHGFTPYTNSFFRSQVKRFSETGNCTVYLARHAGKVQAASVHMHFGGETSYHHGASIQSPLPVSYALQWKAIRDAMTRKDHVYNFWGIAPEGAKKHPFAGVTLFKTGFGGELKELMPCTDMPLSPRYRLTRAFETLRKWKRGF